MRAMRRQGEKRSGVRAASGWKGVMENLFVVILAFYPLRHVSWGIDFWDTGYNYANFTYMGTEHMDPMWLFSTYLSNAVGHLLTKLPQAGSLIGMNFYTGLFASLLALLGYWFCTRRLRIQSWIAFAGELLALSLCWCPTALLYNYMSYLLFLGCVALLYRGLTEEKEGCLIAAGVCLGANVLVRFSNLPQMALILAVWAYDFIVWREEGRRKGALRRTLRHTGLCLLGYMAALLLLLGYIHIRYGIGEYAGGIGRLFAMTETATDYKAVSMLRGIINVYIENLYWVARIAVIGVGGMAMFAVLSAAVRFLCPANRRVQKITTVTICGLWVSVSAAMLGWLYYRGFCSLEFYSYDAILRPGILFLMLTMLIAAIRIFHPGSKREEKLISGILILVILLTSIGSNNGVYPSLNNLFVAAPYTLWESWRFLRLVKTKKIAHVTIDPFPVKGLLAAFLLMCFFQFGFFGAKFVFAEATGIQDTSARVEDIEILKNVKMSEEKARWMTELSAYVRENGLQGQEVILYGNIPSLSYYLQMPSAFNPWSDLRSYRYETMETDLNGLNGKTPVIILENRCIVYLEGGRRALEDLGLEEKTINEMDSDAKLTLLSEFMAEHHYEQDFRNGKFGVYRRKQEE